MGRLTAVIAFFVACERAGSQELFSNVLVNPGFDQGSGQTQITAWTRFNNAYRSEVPFARSGRYALVAWGNWWPTNEWNASGAWQDHPVSPGQIWEASGWLYASSNLQGRAYAAVNLEYYSADSGLLVRASSAVKLDSGSLTGRWIRASVKGKTVPGAAFARIIPIFVQSPDWESGHAYFDDCALYLVPTDTLQWAGYRWEVDDCYGGPGPNYFSTNCVWVDQEERLHLRIACSDNIWWCAAVESLESPGFGRYLWYVDSPVDQLGTSVVGALFIYAAPEVWGTNHNELDIEFSSAWTESTVTTVTYTVQPYTIPGNAQAFYMVLTNSPTSHEIDWRPDRVRFRSWFGHHPSPPPGTVIAERSFVNRGIPVECGQKVIMNLWLYEGRTPSSSTETLEMVVSSFHFEPFRGFLLADDFADPSTGAVWQVVPGGDPPAELYEADGALHISPVPHGPVAGYASTDTFRRNERGCRYVVKGVLRDIAVTEGVPGSDVFLVTSLSTQTNDPVRAPSAAILKGAYDAEADILRLYFRTKTNSPMSEGALLFQGTVSNLSLLLAQDSVELRFGLEPSNYVVEVRLASDGSPIIPSTEQGAASGPLDLDESLTNCYVFFGAQCNSGAVARVQWEAVALGISGRLREDFSLACTGAAERTVSLVWPGAFDAWDDLTAATDVDGPYSRLLSNRPASASRCFCVVTVDAQRCFLRVSRRGPAE